MSNSENFLPQTTGDGSFTFISQTFNEAFHSHFGARQESFFKFAVPTQLAKIAPQGNLRLLDVCYGLGYNTAAALQTIWDVNPGCSIEVICLELDSSVPKAAINHNLFTGWDFNYTEILAQIAFKHQVETDLLQAKLLIGDARETIKLVNQSGFQANAIFLDPFSPPHCPQLWTVEFMEQLAQCLHQNGLLATYSCAAAVRSAMLAAGLIIGSTPPVGRRTPGTIAAHNREENLSLLPPLGQAEQEHLLTRAAIPYQDPYLNDTTESILSRRQQEQQTSPLEPTSKWRKRWLRQG
ncbi:MnmC family methyltransferase [Cronbergia sp. UHCC 0137]|uniref:tRNA (5-methylaminomethyl-2-thiouridine)(34)-methyltransferase MnmD n=1 Tax=Cronbergia sp. UHCC 0137 TaxID=3110239 RepID=UPI002B214A35|nr:MnmC family methyltransferase [Cronbergia sp. UHCC 0137]MEA5619632.1 MnmC family methyltransferase [Cronbergia sp. UHCC 0137]